MTYSNTNNSSDLLGKGNVTLSSLTESFSSINQKSFWGRFLISFEHFIFYTCKILTKIN